MKVLIVGAGEVGYHLAERLSQENQDVVLIESDPERADFAQQHLDIMTVVGNGASLPVLEQAGVRGARMLLAVTSADEVNLIACLAATRLDVEYTIARVSNPEYYTKGSVLSREQLGIDLMINPERECAWETYQLLQSAAATDVAGVTNSEGAEAGWGSGVIALRTSTGFRNAYSSTNVGLGVSVVAGERNTSVSERMQDSISPFSARGIFAAASAPIRSCMTVTVQASGRIATSIGDAVESPPVSL